MSAISTLTTSANGVAQHTPGAPKKLRNTNMKGMSTIPFLMIERRKDGRGHTHAGVGGDHVDLLGDAHAGDSLAAVWADEIVGEDVGDHGKRRRQGGRQADHQHVSPLSRTPSSIRPSSIPPMIMDFFVQKR